MKVETTRACRSPGESPRMRAREPINGTKTAPRGPQKGQMNGMKEMKEMKEMRAAAEVIIISNS